MAAPKSNGTTKMTLANGKVTTRATVAKRGSKARVTAKPTPMPRKKLPKKVKQLVQSKANERHTRRNITKRGKIKALREKRGKKKKKDKMKAKKKQNNANISKGKNKRRYLEKTKSFEPNALFDDTEPIQTSEESHEDRVGTSVESDDTEGDGDGGDTEGQKLGKLVWENGIIPYIVDGDSYDHDLYHKIRVAFDHMEKFTCIKFQRLRKIPENDENFMFITNPNGVQTCVHTNEKRLIPGKRTVVLGYKCMALGEIAHEMMHLLGFSHEHVRADRDKYVNIRWQDVRLGYKRFFEKNPNIEFGVDFPYDYNSVMHYPSKAFTKNGQPTIVPRLPNMAIGQRSALSVLDMKKIDMKYAPECNKRENQQLSSVCKTVMQNPDASEDVSTVLAEMSDEGIKYYSSKIWPRATIYFKFDDESNFSEEEKLLFVRAARHIRMMTCLQILEYDAHKHGDIKDMIVLIHSSSADAASMECKCPPSGKQGGLQEVTLDLGCFDSGTDLLHVLMHIAGFDHQHNAHDRDQYLKINWENILPAYVDSVKMLLPVEASLGFRFDYQSIMQFPWYQYSSNGNEVFIPVWNDGWTMGTWDELSEIDKMKIDKAYKMECQKNDEEYLTSEEEEEEPEERKTGRLSMKTAAEENSLDQEDSSGDSDRRGVLNAHFRRVGAFNKTIPKRL